MFAKTAPEAPPGFTNVKNGRASVTFTGYAGSTQDYWGL